MLAAEAGSTKDARLVKPRVGYVDVDVVLADFLQLFARAIVRAGSLSSERVRRSDGGEHEQGSDKNGAEHRGLNRRRIERSVGLNKLVLRLGMKNGVCERALCRYSYIP